MKIEAKLKTAKLNSGIALPRSCMTDTCALQRARAANTQAIANAHRDTESQAERNARARQTRERKSRRVLATVRVRERSAAPRVQEARCQ